MRFFPIFLDLTGGPVALIGSGAPAMGKLRLLQAAQAQVLWFPLGADTAAQAPQTEAGPGRLEISFENPLCADLSGLLALVSAAGSPLDDEIAARARALRLPVNVVDRPDLSTFIVPAIIDRGDVVVAIGTGGAAPVLARRLRERIEAVMPARIGELAALMARYRNRFTAARRQRSPRTFWQRVVDGPIGHAALAGRMAEAEARLVCTIDGGGGEDSTTGTVFLVGAGPGDPDLLTLRALQVLQDADIVFYDETVSGAILDRARRDARRVFVGKRHGRPGMTRSEIHRRMLEAVRAGQQLVRLAGGDLLAFDHGSEELQYLRNAGIPVIVVPGVSATFDGAAEIDFKIAKMEAA
jgi:uroporphyrin-III C-methyltransferase / precorrin-2 dehydrogenase / sirohydrochlorin ferrochelatase